MITHEIIKPVPKTIYERAKDSVLHLIGTPRQPEHNPTPGSRAYSHGEMFMAKVDYARWIERIKVDFPVNSLRTLSSLAYVPGQVPVPLYKVIQIMEIHWNAPLCEVHKEPRCVLVVTEKYHVPVPYSPKMLRKLTTEELELVRIRDQKAIPLPSEEGYPKCTLVNGEFVLLAADGEIIKRYA